MIKREITKELLISAKEYPVVTILGPRQAGKTTLAMDDPNAFFKRFSGKLIIDEIQRVPELLSYIQVMVDEKEEKGQFILTGSHQLSLTKLSVETG